MRDEVSLEYKVQNETEDCNSQLSFQNCVFLGGFDALTRLAACGSAPVSARWLSPRGASSGRWAEREVGQAQASADRRAHQSLLTT
jgi:hypothetical protein